MQAFVDSKTSADKVGCRQSSPKKKRGLPGQVEDAPSNKPRDATVKAEAASGSNEKGIKAVDSDIARKELSNPEGFAAVPATSDHKDAEPAANVIASIAALNSDQIAVMRAALAAIDVREAASGATGGGGATPPVQAEALPIDTPTLAVAVAVAPHDLAGTGQIEGEQAYGAPAGILALQESLRNDPIDADFSLARADALNFSLFKLELNGKPIGPLGHKVATYSHAADFSLTFKNISPTETDFYLRFTDFPDLITLVTGVGIAGMCECSLISLDKEHILPVPTPAAIDFYQLIDMKNPSTIMMRISKSLTDKYIRLLSGRETMVDDLLRWYNAALGGAAPNPLTDSAFFRRFFEPDPNQSDNDADVVFNTPLLAPDDLPGQPPLDRPSELMVVDQLRGVSDVRVTLG